MSENESRLRLLAAAKSLMLARGYAGTTMDAVCEKAGLTKGSLYYFYKSKEELGLAVLEWSLNEAGRILESGEWTAVENPTARALAYLEHVELSAGKIWSGGCLLASFALELAETHDRMQAAVSGMFKAVASDVARILAPLGSEVTGRGATAAELADQYLEMLEGAVILARAHRDWTRIPRAVRRFRFALAPRVPQAA